MKKVTCVLLLILPFLFSAAQQAVIDSMKKVLATAKTDEEKVEALDLLSRTVMNVNLKEADEYGNQLITLAEESRDRKLMIKAYMSNGTRCSYFAGRKITQPGQLSYFNKALSIAKQNKLDEDAGAAYLKLIHCLSCYSR